MKFNQDRRISGESDEFRRLQFMMRTSAEMG
jgi:hypothetical protein